MNAYIISYDLIGNKNYNILIEAIKKYFWIKILDSMWVVHSTKSAKDLASEFMKSMDSDDRIIVAKVSIDCARNNVVCGDQVLKENLMPK